MSHIEKIRVIAAPENAGLCSPQGGATYLRSPHYTGQFTLLILLKEKNKALERSLSYFIFHAGECAPMSELGLGGVKTQALSRGQTWNGSD
jgi:hypothetical protein